MMFLRHAASRQRYTPVSLEDLGGIAETRRVPSQTKPPLDLVVGNASSSVQFRKAGLDLGQKHQALDRVVDGRIRR